MDHDHFARTDTPVAGMDIALILRRIKKSSAPRLSSSRNW